MRASTPIISCNETQNPISQCEVSNLRLTRAIRNTLSSVTQIMGALFGYQHRHCSHFWIAMTCEEFFERKTRHKITNPI